MLCSLFQCGITGWISKTCPLEMGGGGGGQTSESMYAMGGRRSVHVRTTAEGGQHCIILVRTY